MDAAEYKHVVLGLIFLKYISDAFEERHALLESERSTGADPEDPDEYRAKSIFWVPPEARWAHLKAQARQPTIGQLVDDAWAASSATIRRSRACCPGTTRARRSTRRASASSST
jgi:type I restriction enzyme M protein